MRGTARANALKPRPVATARPIRAPEPGRPRPKKLAAFKDDLLPIKDLREHPIGHVACISDPGGYIAH